MRRLALALTLLGCAHRASPGPTSAAARPGALAPEPEGPLPQGVTPLRYALSLELVPSRERFSGEVEVRVRLDAASSGLWMHGRDLDVREVRVAAGAETRRARWVPGARAGVASVRWEGTLGPGELTLRLRYDARFNRHLEGLYRVDEGDDHYAFTQFEALSARRAMPCFDDPRFKTPFEITLTVPRGEVAVTNTRELSESPRGDDLRALRFAPTEPLPTYLLAFAVGPLDVVEHAPIPPNEHRATPVPLRGVAARGRGALLARSLDDAAPLVARFERYFARAYPYPKLDLIAVPDFAAGAMENAGAITFREPLLLLRPDAPVDQVRAMDHVLAHELAHHWFGDLVTLRWWDDIWLNESFATWAATWSTDDVFPAHGQGLALLSGVHDAMAADALSEAVPVRREVPTERALRGGSSAIVYQKGASVLRMLERWIGEDRLRDGVRAYLRAHEHGSATADDLLSALQRAAPELPVDRVARGFIAQPGVPVLAMARVCEGGRARVRVSQRRFALPAGSDTRPGSWSVPVCVRYGSAGAEPRRACALTSSEQPFIDLDGACPDWLMPNADADGYFRGALLRADLDALVTHGWSALGPRERLAAVADAIALFSAGVYDLATLRGLLARAAADPERLVLTRTFGFWQRVLEDHAAPTQIESFRAEITRYFAGRWGRLGWSPGAGEGASEALLRRDLAAFLALTVGDVTVRAEGARRARAHLGGGPALSSELLQPCVAMLVREDPGAAPGVIARALGSRDAVERQALLSALGEAHASALVTQVLPLTLDPRVRLNEMLLPLRVAMRRGASRGVAFAWMTAHADALDARLSEGARGALPWIASRFCDEGDRARVSAHFTPRLPGSPGSEAQLRGALEAIDVCVAERAAQRRTFGDGAPASPATPAR